MTRKEVFSWILAGMAIQAMIGLLAGCAPTLYPVTSGAHRSLETGRYLVWSNHPGVTSYITGILLENRHPVVERAKLETIFEEQHLILSHAKDGDVLRVGKLTGATQVIFAEVTQTRRGFLDDPTLSVTLRAVSIESGEVLWTGRAAFTDATSDPDYGAIYLTHWAWNRATCQGAWEEPTWRNKGGCQQAVATPVKTQKQEPGMWKAMKGMER